VLRFLIDNPAWTLALAAVVGILLFGAPNISLSRSCLASDGYCDAQDWNESCDYFGVGGMRTIFPDDGKCPLVKLLPLPGMPHLL